MKLSNRLMKIAQLIPRGARIADIGTDHAYLPVYCVQNKISPCALAMDINEGPLSAAHANVCKYGVGSGIELRLSDGLSALEADEADVIVIAGMGGLLIRNIIDAKPSAAKTSLLILQPMNAAKELREYLYSSGYCIQNEYIAHEPGKYYNIILAKTGDDTADDEDMIVGRNVYKTSPEEFSGYMKSRINTLKKITDGIGKSDTADGSTAEHELEVYERTLKKYEGK